MIRISAIDGGEYRAANAANLRRAAELDATRPSLLLYGWCGTAGAAALALVTLVIGTATVIGGIPVVPGVVLTLFSAGATTWSVYWSWERLDRAENVRVEARELRRPVDEE